MANDQGHVIVAGGSVGGLATALALGRLGHPVTVLERDAISDYGDAEAAFADERLGAPQAHQTHGFLARLTVVLKERFPDVLEVLLDHGAESLTLTGSLGEYEPGDEDLNTLIVRRTTFEWALRDAVSREPHVNLRSATGVQGLLFDTSVGRPHVTGVRLSDGSELLGDVVACTGRRGEVLPWLSEAGVVVAEEVVNSEITYLTRWYRRPADLQVTVDPRLGGDFGYLKYLAIPCDGSTFSVTLAVRSSDSELRKVLLDPAAFDRACHTLPGPDRFFVSDEIEPIGPVRPMGGLINRLRHFADASGQPLVTGFHAVGDAHTCTNPMYGRGCSLAFVQAALLADAFASHPADPLARAAAYEASSKLEVEPWYHSSVMMDSMGSGDGEGQASNDFTRKFGLLIADVMLGRPTDPIIARGLLRMINTLIRPDELMADAEFLTRIATYFAAPDGDYSEIEALRVSRGSLLTAVAA